MNDMQETQSIIVTGKVQGVFYRQTTHEKAVALGITGTVMNQPDGSVKIIATGTAEQLKQFTEWCRQGPAKAVVENLLVTPMPLQVFANFKVIRRS